MFVLVEAESLLCRYSNQHQPQPGKSIYRDTGGSDCKLERIRQAVRLVAAPPSQSSTYSAAFNVAAFVRTS
jgi:hypothetical protein